MRVLIDESLPRALASALKGHEVRTVQQEGWSSISNGELLRLAVQSGFEVFLTPDRNLQYQQNIPKAGIGIVVLRGASNRIEDLLPLVPDLAKSNSTRSGRN
ncbi:MAG: DUF5615 family PIN-like protein [Gemmatimonadaceae bacterium]